MPCVVLSLLLRVVLEGRGLEGAASTKESVTLRVRLVVGVEQLDEEIQGCSEKGDDTIAHWEQRMKTIFKTIGLIKEGKIKIKRMVGQCFLANDTFYTKK